MMNSNKMRNDPGAPVPDFNYQMSLLVGRSRNKMTAITSHIKFMVMNEKAVISSASAEKKSCDRANLPPLRPGTPMLNGLMFLNMCLK